MLKLINVSWKSKLKYIVLILVSLTLLNLRIIIKNEVMNTRILSVLVTNAGWYFLSSLLLLVLRVIEFYRMIFTNNTSIISKSESESYRFIGSRIIGGLVEIIVMTVLLISVIAINLQLINSNFLKESINVLELSGIYLSREIPLLFIILISSYALLLETIYLSIIIVKKLFLGFKYKKILSVIFFNSISLINGFVIYGMFKNVSDFNSLSVTIILVKTFLLLLLWYLLAGFLLTENKY